MGLVIKAHREVVWVIFGLFSINCLRLLCRCGHAGKRACDVHHVHSVQALPIRR
jgi:hypothetical protein